MHFYYSPVKDLIIFPEDAVFKHIPESNARCYALELQGKRHFFWMQDLSDSKDKKNCSDINEYINNPPGPGGGGFDLDLDQNQRHLLQMFAQSGGTGLSDLLRGIRLPSQPQSQSSSQPAQSTPSRVTPAATAPPTNAPLNKPT